MKTFFSLESSFITKQKANSLLLLSVEPNNNSLFEFEGASSKILEKLFEQNTFTYETAEELAKSHQADLKDLKKLWDFCLENNIITKA